MSAPVDSTPYVEIPAAAVEPFGFGLLSVADEVVPPGNQHWQLYGLTHPTDGCVLTGGVEPLPCPVPAQPPAPLDPVKGVDYVRTSPLQVYDSASCALGLVDGRVRAERRLALHEQVHVERQVDELLLRPGAVDLTAGVALPVAEAVSVIEDAIAGRYGGHGVLHVPRKAYGVLVERRQLHLDDTGRRLRTMLGNRAAIGAGYAGASPAGVAAPAGQVWLYATGPARYAVSEVLVGEPDAGRDLRTNEQLVRVDRWFAVTLDCLRVAVLVDLRA